MTGLDYRIENPSCVYCLYGDIDSFDRDCYGGAGVCRCIIVRDIKDVTSAKSCKCYFPDPRDIRELDDIVEG